MSEHGVVTGSFVQEVLDLAPAANTAVVENSVCAAEVDSTEKGQRSLSAIQLSKILYILLLRF